MSLEINQTLSKEDRIYVERFSDLHGLGQETLIVINTKIASLKT